MKESLGKGMHNTVEGIGEPIRRSEDIRFVSGLGRYTDDFAFVGSASLVAVRSPHAAARISGIDTVAARAAPGVLAVMTGEDLRRENFAPLASRVQRYRADGTPNFVPPYLPLALDVVPHLGVIVAIVVAETFWQARDAAELVEVDYEPLECVTDTLTCLAPDAPRVWEGLPDNRCFQFELGDKAQCEAAFARAVHVVRDRVVLSRMTANSLEPRNAIGVYEQQDSRYTLYSSLQSPHTLRNEIAKVFRRPENRFRVVSLDVGGSFGMKGSLYPEQILVLWAARVVNRPVRWVADRSEGFLADHQARDNVSDVELALDGGGRFLGLRVTTAANVGAYIASNGLHSSTNNLGGLAGVYMIPAFDVRVTGVFSNTPPTCPFRGAGRPEASYCVEAIIDRAARELKIDRVELRRRNMIPASAMPYKTNLVFNYDSGEFEAVMDKCLGLADWDNFESRREASRRRGLLRGIGLACVIESAGGPQNAPLEESVEIRFDASGSCTMLVGSHSHGQGHETIYRQFAAEFLGLSGNEVRVVCGDTDAVPHGRGSFGSRTMMVGGTACLRAAERVIDRGKQIAAHLLEVESAELVFEGSNFVVPGTDLQISLKDVARASYISTKLPRGQECGLDGKASSTEAGATFPNGCHICEVELDPETGQVALVRYSVVDDVGREVNPLLVQGQIHGGIAQGAGQALMEQISYDGDGQLLTGTFMDYTMPRAGNLPSIRMSTHDVPTSTNPLGVKGAGEAGTVGALPAVMSAVLDALHFAGVNRLDMPATPQNVWAALEAAKSTTSRAGG